MEKLVFDYSKALGFFSESELEMMKEQVAVAEKFLNEKNGAGNDYLGWIELPTNYDKDEFERIKKAAEKIKNDSDVLVVIGIGGSYLGARAAIDFLSHTFYNSLTKEQRKAPEIYYVGNNISSTYLKHLLDVLEGKDYSINVISKSGTTTEPAIAFRILKEMLEKQEGKEFASKHIVAVTDAAKGALRTLANEEGYTSYVIEDNIGGRFSVLTPVGLLPIAIAGFNIRQLIEGAKNMEMATINADDNIAVEYAKTRNALYNSGKKIEILVNYNPKLHFLAEWWKQLYGESEGKENKGIFPASVDNSTDLHSMGQWIQEGERTIFETVISVAKQQHEVRIPSDEANLDGLNYIANKRIDEVNKMAELGTVIAHVDGGVPNIHITLPELSEYHLGEIIYFFEKACGISGYILDVNPFNQPGVEAYKKNMFALLEKPGYEEATKAIQAKLK